MVSRPLRYVALLLLFCAPALAVKPLYRPAQEYRTTSSDLYEISVQKNGRVDVNLIAGPHLPVIANAHPRA